MAGSALHRRPKEHVYRGMLFRITIYQQGVYAFSPENGWQGEWDTDDPHVWIWNAGVRINPTLFPDSTMAEDAPPLTRRLAIQLLCHSMWEESAIHPSNRSTTEATS